MSPADLRFNLGLMLAGGGLMAAIKHDADVGLAFALGYAVVMAFRR